MRKILSAVVLLSMSVGCQQLTGDRATIGWDWHVYKPSSVQQDAAVLINQGAASTNAHPMGTTSGPIIEAQSSHAPTTPAPASMPRISRRMAPTSAIACPPDCQPITLTLEEWQKLSQSAGSKRMPSGE